MKHEKKLVTIVKGRIIYERFGYKQWNLLNLGELKGSKRTWNPASKRTFNTCLFKDEFIVGCQRFHAPTLLRLLATILGYTLSDMPNSKQEYNLRYKTGHRKFDHYKYIGNRIFFHSSNSRSHIYALQKQQFRSMFKLLCSHYEYEIED